MLMAMASVASQGEMLVSYDMNNADKGDNTFPKFTTSLGVPGTYGLVGKFSNNVKLTKLMFEIPYDITVAKRIKIWAYPTLLLDVPAISELIDGKYYLSAQLDIQLSANIDYTLACTINSSSPQQPEGTVTTSTTINNQQILDALGSGSFFTHGLQRYGATLSGYPGSASSNVIVLCIIEGKLI